MTRIAKQQLSFNHQFSSPKEESELNKLSNGCAPCLDEALKIDKQINRRSLNQIKIEEIKEIVNSLFKDKKNNLNNKKN